MFVGIILVFGGLDLLYLFTFSHWTINLVLGVVNIIFGIILISSYKFPDLLRYYGKKQSQEIIEYNKIIELNFKDTTALNNKGTAFVKIGRFHDAIKCFDKVIEIDPKDGGAYHNKGVVLDNLGKPKEAIEHYDKALNVDPKLEKAKQTRKIILES